MGGNSISKNTQEPYHPKIIEDQVKVSKQSGTEIKLMKIKRKTGFQARNLATSLAKSFQIFDEPDFKTEIFHNNEAEPIVVNNDLRYEGFDKFIEWNSPWSEISFNQDEENKYKTILKK